MTGFDGLQHCVATAFRQFTKRVGNGCPPAIFRYGKRPHGNAGYFVVFENSSSSIREFNRSLSIIVRTGLTRGQDSRRKYKLDEFNFPRHRLPPLKRFDESPIYLPSRQLYNAMRQTRVSPSPSYGYGSQARQASASLSPSRRGRGCKKKDRSLSPSRRGRGNPVRQRDYSLSLWERVGVRVGMRVRVIWKFPLTRLRLWLAGSPSLRIPLPLKKGAGVQKERPIPLPLKKGARVQKERPIPLPLKKGAREPGAATRLLPLPLGEGWGEGGNEGEGDMEIPPHPATAMARGSPSLRIPLPLKKGARDLSPLTRLPSSPGRGLSSGRRSRSGGPGSVNSKRIDLT